MKPHSVAGCASHVPWIPRRNRRGLIEAAPERELHQALQPIPRRNRRGLIEAAPPRRLSCTNRPGFPGEIAGASLKLGGPAGIITLAALGFPGEIAGASLKRGRPTGIGTARRRRFPGEIAGASLKRDLPVVDERPEAGFPGEIAGASLKLHQPALDQRTERSIPRRNRRGLIEADRWGTSCGRAPSDSPAKSPGPH